MTYKKLWCIAVTALVMWSAGTAYSQIYDRNTLQSESGTNPLQSAVQGQSLVRPSVLDGPVIGSEYIVGPGDVFNVSVWSSVPLSLSVTVTPEGTVIIPTVGEFGVAGKNLDDVKRSVIAEIRKKYTQQQVSFTLSAPRSFAVVVKGNVLNEGKYIVQATDRADAAVDLANSLAASRGGTADNERRKALDRILGDASQRRVEVLHVDGTKSIVDFERYYATRDSKYNGYLRDGDLVIVPKKDIVKNFFSIYGAVNKEGVYEYRTGDRLQTAITIARGVTALVDSTHVVVMRSDAEGHRTGEFVCSLIGINQDGGMLLQRGDQIVVGEKLDLARNYRISIEGEVNSPGYYPITKDSTTLSSVIARAKGFTESASLKTSRLYRKTVNEKDIQDERLESARGGYTPEDSSYYFLETNIRINREQVPVDFEELFALKNHSKDVFLKDGDVVSIGSKVKTIYIFGQVVRPGHYVYKPDQEIERYIAEAGGYTKEARDSDVRIIKANTRQWLAPSQTTIEEGDYIWVPKEPYRTGGYYLQQMSQIFGILGTVATLALLVVQITK